MPKIAHISDIHFGKNFDVEVWKNVRKRIEEFNPDLLVVSGDLVDHPWPFPMLAVKVELLALCTSCPSKPELFVVPGNHDVRLWGNVRLRLADPIGLVEEVIAVAQRFLCVLIDRNGDRLDVLIAVTLSRGPLPQFGKRVEPGRVVRLLVVPFQLFAHHQLRPPMPAPLKPGSGKTTLKELRLNMRFWNERGRQLRWPYSRLVVHVCSPQSHLYMRSVSPLRGLSILQMSFGCAPHRPHRTVVAS